MIAIRNSNPELQLGTYKTLIADNKKDIFAFERIYKDTRTIVILNNSSKKQSISIKLGGNKAKDLLNEKTYTSKNGALSLKINSKWGAVLKVN